MALTDWLFGRHLASDEEGEQRVGVVAGIPMLGLDALGSTITKNGQNGDYYRDPDMKPDLKALQANIDLQHELGLVKATIDVAKHAELGIIEEAAKRLK